MKYRAAVTIQLEMDIDGIPVQPDDDTEWIAFQHRILEAVQNNAELWRKYLLHSFITEAGLLGDLKIAELCGLADDAVLDSETYEYLATQLPGEDIDQLSNALNNDWFYEITEPSLRRALQCKVAKVSIAIRDGES